MAAKLVALELDDKREDAKYKDIGCKTSSVILAMLNTSKTKKTMVYVTI